PDWPDGADLMFAEAAGRDRPIRFRGEVGGHASVAQVAAEAVSRGVTRLVYAHVGRPALRAMDAGLLPAFGEWGPRAAPTRCLLLNSGARQRT
ncbi:MAG TPA: hypothetical protein VH307_14545, partial [Streptosporangiaceae bacterium]|nr:hypothetical protein [Streptosporangiaceae bacterium]